MKFFKNRVNKDSNLLMSHEHLNYCMIFSNHKEEVDKLNLKKLATDFVLNVPKRKNFFAVPE